MAQASYEDYKALYGEDELDQAAFGRLAWEARRIMDDVTTGVDGVRKLDEAMPEDERGAEAVRRCALALVRKLGQMESAQGTVSRADGTVTGRVVTDLTAGAESVRFAAPEGQVSGEEERRRALRQTAEEYLAGVADKNGVPLLYAGPYPCRAGED